MKRLIPTFAILFACAAIAWAEAPATLTTLRQIRTLSNGEGNKGFPVAFEATVTYSRRDERFIFVQDGDDAIFVVFDSDADLLPGDRVLIKGTTSGSYKPIVISQNVTLLHHGGLPKPVNATHQQLVKGQFDCRLVSVRGVVLAADFEAKQPWMRKMISDIQLRTESGPITVFLDTDDLNAPRSLLDTEVEITGVSGGMFDDKMQLTGTVLYVPGFTKIKILDRPKISPWLAPVTSLDNVLSVYDMHDLTPRIRVQGTITYYQPGHAIVLQDGLKSLWIDTITNEPLRIGDRANAIGFTNAHDRYISLIDAEIRDSLVFAPIAPRPSTWMQLANWSSNRPDGHQNDLVSIDGKVVAEVREATQDEFVMDTGGGLFTAIYHHPPENSYLPPMMKIPLGSRIRTTGICTRTDTKSAIPGKEVPFNILLRSFDDILVIQGPSLVNTRNLLLVLGLLLIVVFVVIGRGWALERKMRRQTAVLSALTKVEAELERQRSRILEDINGSRPLAEILEEIAALVSSTLEGAPCWCEVADGARLGDYPLHADHLRIIQVKIPARNGSPLGVIFAAIDPLSMPRAVETEALSMSARLATLAIETRRLYSDLLHRSEFDLLTDIHNRFSLGKLLDAQIDQARLEATVFGLIYIDLDNFKQVNDSYGHQVGDQYLQQVALRLKKQLRPHDKLARLGGDEFAALVPMVRSRAEVEEIAQRLEHCFNEAFVIESLTLTGSASVGISLYPEDGATRDDLLNAADAAMYIVKNAKRPTEKSLPQSQHSELSAEVRS
ncbi:MAG: diguanylate cyclase domain-containing protein [Terracidiphilus sp.]